MQTSRNSIKAITFTIILFLFILFISLFKGIYLYDIKFKNIQIKKLFFKIDNKIVLKIYNIKIKNNKEYVKQALNLHKTVLTAVKFLNIFQTVSINSLKYSSFSIDKITLEKNRLNFKSDFLTFNSVLKPDKNYTFINFVSITLPKLNLNFKNTLFNIYFKPDNIFIKGRGNLNNGRFDFNLSLSKNNILKADFYTDELRYANNLFNFKLKNSKAEAIINLNYMLYKIETHINKATIRFGKKNINIQKSKTIVTNNKIKLKTDTVYIPEFKNVKNIKIRNLKATYNIANSFLVLNFPEINSVYKHYLITSYGNSLVFKSLQNLNFFSKTIKINDKKFFLTFNTNILNIFENNRFFSVNNGEFVSKEIKLKSSEIIGDLTKIFTQKIYGKAFGFNTSIQNITADLKKKSLFIKEISYNNLKAYNISYKKDKITLHSNSLFDKNAKNIINKFLHIEIPLLQTGGKNRIISNIKINKNIKSFTNIITSTSLFKLFDFDLFVPSAEINITNSSLYFKTKKSKLYLTKKIKLTYSGDGLINYKKRNLSMKGNVDFKIDNIINLKDYNETADINFSSKTLKTQNSKVYIDFDKKELIINPLKNILKYTSFEPFVKNGILLITFSKTTDITTYLLLKLPVLYKHSNLPIKNTTKNLIDKIFLNITVGNSINIYNKNLQIQIKNSNINASLHSLDINLYPLETLLYKNSGPNEFNYTVNLYTNNANLIYKTHKFLSQRATLTYQKNNLKFQSLYKKSSVEGYTKQGYLLLEGKNFSNEEFKAFLPNFNFFSVINMDFIMVKSPDDFYSGKIYINRAVVRELKSLNNIIAFINTIPSILSFSSPGFSSKGYKIRKGYINYLLYKKILYIKQAEILGDNLDFYAKGYIDLDKNYIFLKITANMKMRLKKIPIIGKGLSYLLFGKDGSIDIKMIVKGNLDNPEVTEDLGKDILLSPFKLFKRAVTLPFNLF